MAVRHELVYDETQKSCAEDIWEGLLGKIDVEGDEERKRTFYSCLYRAFLYPTKFYETDKSGAQWHVEPESNAIKQGVMYTNNGFWDTYRTVYPLYSLVIPDRLREILVGYLNFYDDTGYLPRWPSPSEFGCMPGTLIEAVFADAIVKDILSGEDARRALAAMLKNARVQSCDCKQGRKCVQEYEALGYVPYDLCRESVNETLDCAYGDYCIAVVAEKLGEHKIAEEFYARSKNYRNLFDSKSGFMRAKDSRGNFRDNFDCFSWGRDYTEGSAWQNSFAVPHDVAGLAKLYGGKDKLIAKMDELFDTPPIFRVGGYGNEIHEMTEMAAVDFGQCAISNQPSFHFPFMFSELGNRNKTIRWVERLVTEVFGSGDDGFPGDEDNGTMACWYIFACLGFYPMCPGRAEYTLSKPLFDKITVNGKILDSALFDKAKTKILHKELR